MPSISRAKASYDVPYAGLDRKWAHPEGRRLSNPFPNLLRKVRTMSTKPEVLEGLDEKYQLYLGIPRHLIPWFPTIDEEKCVGC